MTFSDALRWGWTFLNGWGVIFALWNVREVLVDYWAIRQVDRRTRPINVLQLQVRAEIYLHAMILLALFANFIAGVFSLTAVPNGAVVALIVSAFALIVLSFNYARRRQQIFKALSLRSRRDNDANPKQAPEA